MGKGRMLDKSFTKDKLYDYESALGAGMKPDEVTKHWASRIPHGENEGLILKSEEHPTFWRTLEGEDQAGNKVYRNSTNNRLYSFPKDNPASDDLFPYIPNRKIYGYETRIPQKTELQYFKKNPTVSGMATEDGRIILNPYSELSSTQRNSVAQNEAIRLYLRENKINPTFQITPEQHRIFANTPYVNDELALKHTILGRILSNDPSVGSITEDQKLYSSYIWNELQKRK